MIKAFFSALVPVLPLAALSTLCASILCGLNFGLAIFIQGVIENGLRQDLGSLIPMIFSVTVPIAFLLTWKASFFPNLAGIFFILFLALDGKCRLVEGLSKRKLISCGGGYGVCICAISMLTMVKPWAAKEVLDALLFSIVLFPAAILSGIITLKLIEFLLQYKFSRVTRPTG